MKLIRWLLLINLLTPVSLIADDGEIVGDYRVFQSLNFRFKDPGDEYQWIWPSMANQDANLAFIKNDNGAVVMVLAEHVGSYLTAQQMETLADVSNDPGYSDYQVLKQSQSTIAGLEAQIQEFSFRFNNRPKFAVKASLTGGEYGYQIVITGRPNQQQGIRKAAQALFTNFEFLTPPEKPKSFVDLYAYQSEASGLRLTMDDHWVWHGDNDEPVSEISGFNFDSGSYFWILPFCHGPIQVKPEQLFKAMLDGLGLDYVVEQISPLPLPKPNQDYYQYNAGPNSDQPEDFIRYIRFTMSEHCTYMVTLEVASLSHRQLQAEEKNKVVDKLFNQFIFDPLENDQKYANNSSQQNRNAYFFNRLGVNAYTDEQYLFAADMFELAFQIKPDYVTYLTNLLSAYNYAKLYEQGVMYSLKYAESFSTDLSVKSWQAWFYYKTADFVSAKNLYQQLFKNGHRSAEDFDAYLESISELEQWDFLELELIRYGKDLESGEDYRLRAKYLNKAKRYKSAIAMLEPLVNHNNADTELVKYLYNAYEAQDQWANVRDLAQTQIQLGQINMTHYFWLGDAYLKLKQYQQSKEAFEQADQLSPGNKTIQNYLNHVSGLLGQGETLRESDRISAVDISPTIKEWIGKPPPIGFKERFDSYYEYYIRMVDFEQGKHLVVTDHQKINILEASGVERFSTIKFSFDPQVKQIFVNSLVVRDSQGGIIYQGKLGDYYLADTENSEHADFERSLFMPIKGLKTGMSIDLSISWRYLNAGYEIPLERYWFSAGRPIQLSALEINGDIDHLDFLAKSVDPPERENGLLRWSIREPEPFIWESYQADYSEFMPSVLMGSKSKSWADVGNDYLKQVEHLLNRQDEIQAALNTIGPDRSFNAIGKSMAFVQNELVYKAIEFGRRGQIPNSPATSINSGYGDCKDHALLLQTLLQAQGFEAYLSLVSTDGGVSEKIPSLDHFNHMIVAVETNRGLLFIDATDKNYDSINGVPRKLAGHLALILKADKPELSKIGSYDFELSHIEVSRDVHLTDRDALTVKEVLTAHGTEAASLRDHFRDMEVVDYRQTLQRWLSQYIPRARLQAFSVNQLNQVSLPLSIELEFIVPNGIKTLADDKVLIQPAMSERFFLKYQTGQRQTDFFFEMPQRLKTHTRIHLPDADFRDSKLRSREGNNRFGRWKQTMEWNHAQHIATMRFDFERRSGFFEKKGFPAFSRFIDNASAAANPLLPLPAVRR